MEADTEGQYVLYTDHLAAVKAAEDAEREAIAVFVETHRYSVGNERRMEPSKHAIDDMHHATIAAAIRARANGGE